MDDTLKIRNMDLLTVDSIARNQSKHGALLPNSVRCIITGPSSSGKTNVAFNMLTEPKGLHYNNVYIFSKSLNQPKYLLLRKILSTVPEVCCFCFDSNANVVTPDKAQPYSVFIFDDVSCENHDTIRKHFAMGRHFDIDSIYIGQTYSKIPKQLIRDNVNLLVIFKQDETNLKHIYNDHVGTDCSFEKFKEVCAMAWNNNFGFLVISKDCPLNKGRYRLGFDKLVIFT